MLFLVPLLVYLGHTLYTTYTLGKKKLFILVISILNQRLCLSSCLMIQLVSRMITFSFCGRQTCYMKQKVLLILEDHGTLLFILRWMHILCEKE